MSRGPGKIERAIVAAFDAEPRNAFTTEDMCDRAYAGINRIEKKHRVSVLRSMNSIVAKDNNFELMTGHASGGTSVIYDAANVHSYSVARLKSDNIRKYRSNDPRTPAHWLITETDIHDKLKPDGCDHHLLTGAWRRHTEMYKAEKAGNAETLRRLEAEQSADISKSLVGLAGSQPS